MSGEGRVAARRLSEVAVYERVVGASIERIWENVLDWEHLPWLHAASFSRVELLESRADGWRARVGIQPAARAREAVIETHLEFAQRRYLTLTAQGVGAGTEIWTELFPRGADATGIRVRFLVPDVAGEHRAAIGAAYRDLYARLWDEDEAMMRRRQQRLGERRLVSSPAAPLELGPVDELRRRLPLLVEYGGRQFRLIESGGHIFAHAILCPHQLGPLEDSPIEDDCVRCPWHGYRFDLKSGRCLDAPALRLARAPRVIIDEESGATTLSSA